MILTGYISPMLEIGALYIVTKSNCLVLGEIYVAEFSKNRNRVGVCLLKNRSNPRTYHLCDVDSHFVKLPKLFQICIEP